MAWQIYLRLLGSSSVSSVLSTENVSQQRYVLDLQSYLLVACTNLQDENYQGESPIFTTEYHIQG